jgi:hypothetical protein
MKFRDLEWWIIGFLALVAFVLSISGDSVLLDAGGIQRNTLYMLDQSVKIFGMDFIDGFSLPLPWQLETVRWLAPALVIYTAIKGIMYLIRREIKSVLINYCLNPIIVMGLNERSRLLISDLLTHGEKVVAVGDIADERKLDPALSLFELKQHKNALKSFRESEKISGKHKAIIGEIFTDTRKLT